MATTAFECLKNNTNATALDGVCLADYEQTFRIAALMHDCAHAFFSHAFETHYSKNNRARDFLFEFVDESFQKDYKKRLGLKVEPKLEPAPHEVFSAAILLKHFSDVCGADAAHVDLKQINLPLAARMITGCLHSLADTQQEKIENCLIQLVNGPAIDVDKLDYVIRDTWSSGVDNVSIDVQRLLSALEIVSVDGKPTVAFRKSALSVIESVLDGRNFLFKWVYSHHTVCYFSRLLRDAVEALNEVLSPPDKQDAFFEAVFSRQAFVDPVQVGTTAVFLPCDDDIYSLLKTHKDDIPQVKELLSRNPARIPLWKTHAEFETLFEEHTTPQRGMLKAEVPTILKAVLGGDLCDTILVESVKPKIASFDEGKIWVKLLGKVVPFQEIVKKWRGATAEKKNVSFFYVYVPREAEDKIQDCITALKDAPIEA